jgi:NitT/TauT family transport system substrate-binding protein
VAKVKGYFQAEGIDAQMNLVAGNVAVPALLKGEIDMTNHGSAMLASMQGAGSMKSIYFPYNTSTLNLVLNTSKAKEAKDLVGQTVAVDTLGNLQDLGTRAILKSLGVDPQSVNITPIQNSQNRVTAMLSGQVAASADNPAIAGQVLQQGGSGFKKIADSSKVMNIPWAGYAVTSQYITDHHATLVGWERAMVKALQFARQNPDETIDIIVKETQLDKDVAKTALPLLVDVMYPDDPGGWSEQTMRNQIDLTRSQVPGLKDATIDEVADAGPVREAQKSLGIQCKGGYKC